MLSTAPSPNTRRRKLMSDAAVQNICATIIIVTLIWVFLR